MENKRYTERKHHFDCEISQPDSQEICTLFMHCKRHFFVRSDSGSASSKAHRMRHSYNSLERIIGLLVTLSFQDHNLLIFTENWDQRKKFGLSNRLDNQGLDN